MILCVCRGVSDRTVRALIAAGAQTRDEVLQPRIEKVIPGGKTVRLYDAGAEEGDVQLRRRISRGDGQGAHRRAVATHRGAQP